MPSSREKGDKLETRVSQDLGVPKTTNSGAKWGNADLTDRKLIIECKVKSKDGFQPCKTEIKKLIVEATKHDKEWIYVQSTNDRTYAVVDYDFLVSLYQAAQMS